ncbi:hypothetical protein TNCV_1114761 [Trichonephila clavipes]|nr:hypothetical protein TNCV_1114761 [Trichonephila clavipes]
MQKPVMHRTVTVTEIRAAVDCTVAGYKSFISTTTPIQTLSNKHFTPKFLSVYNISDAKLELTEEQNEYI